MELLEKMSKNITYLTCHSNTTAQVLDIIRSQEQIHWYWGLRQAELHIEYIRPSLEYVNTESIKLPAIKKIKSQQVKVLQLINHLSRFIPILGAWIEYKISLIQSEIRYMEDPEQIQKMNQRITDAKAEMDVAIAERDRIILEHPEVKQMSYEEIQAISVDALLEKKAFLITASQLGVHYGLSESTSTLLAELNQGDLVKVLGMEYRRLLSINSVLQPQNKESSKSANIFPDKFTPYR